MTPPLEQPMRRHLRNPRVWIAAGLLLAVWLLWPRPVSPPIAELPAEAPPAASAPSVATPAPSPADTLPGFLPREARETVALILAGGPFPHPQDGTVFGNRERRLPEKPRGYYREYTVTTPGIDHRGGRRIVTGGTPPEVWYYSDDHYDSFRAFAVPAGGRP